jgi:hypothetical protein
MKQTEVFNTFRKTSPPHSTSDSRPIPTSTDIFQVTTPAFIMSDDEQVRQYIFMAEL